MILLERLVLLSLHIFTNGCCSHVAAVDVAAAFMADADSAAAVFPATDVTAVFSGCRRCGFCRYCGSFLVAAHLAARSLAYAFVLFQMWQKQLLQTDLTASKL